MRSSSARWLSDMLRCSYAAGGGSDHPRSSRRRISSAALRSVFSARSVPWTWRFWRLCWLRTRTNTSPAPAAVPIAAAATGRAQLRGSRIAPSSQLSSSSAAASVRVSSVLSRRIDSVSGGSTGASARRSMPSMSANCSLTSGHAPGGADDLLELLDRTMDQHLGGAVGAAHGPCDLAVVHAQRLAAVVGKLLDPLEDSRQLVAPLHEVLGRVGRADHRRVLDRRLGLAR